MDDLFDTLAGSNIFSKIDLTARYNQVQIAPGDEAKTTFSTRYRSFKCCMMNFGRSSLYLSPSGCQDSSNK